MRLDTLGQESGDWWYKGLSPWSGSENFKKFVGNVGVARIGFMSTKKLAMVYAQPSLTGKRSDSTILIRARVPSAKIEDRTKQFKDLGYKDISVNFPSQWRDEGPWTVTISKDISAHGGEPFIYVGVPWKYEVIATFSGEEDWEEAAERGF